MKIYNNWEEISIAEKRSLKNHYGYKTSINIKGRIHKHGYVSGRYLIENMNNTTVVAIAEFSNEIKALNLIEYLLYAISSVCAITCSVVITITIACNKELHTKDFYLLAGLGGER